MPSLCSELRGNIIYWLLCVSLYAVYMFMCMHVYVETWGLHLYCLRQGIPLNLELTVLTRPWLMNSKDPSSPSSLAQEVQTHATTSGFYVGSRHPNSGPSPCIPSTLLTKVPSWLHRIPYWYWKQARLCLHAMDIIFWFPNQLKQWAMRHICSFWLRQCTFFL